MFDAGVPCGAEGFMAKMLASEASWNAGDVHANPWGFYVTKEYHIERKFRDPAVSNSASINQPYFELCS